MFISKKGEVTKVRPVRLRIDPTTIPVCKVLIPVKGTVLSTLVCLRSLINQLKRHPENREVINFYMCSESNWLMVDLNLENSSDGSLLVKDLISIVNRNVISISLFDAGEPVKTLEIDNSYHISLK
ncbi:hypothetical protein [Paenibacillus sp. Leaf72]|uniref:hypothetical protein n=1 Tax=Paenibacillus sp. Leaf72 TaxID=1736234 RepID=UPI000AD7F76C|nr:hypothetical protein [Paenibacillus sp. Leaf72]